MLIVGLSPAAARADSINLTLDNPVLSDVPGDTVTFSATGSAPFSNSEPVFLNGDSFDIGSSPFITDDTDFFADAPFFLEPGGSFDGDLFTVTLDADAVIGTYYSGTYILQGGAGGSAQDALASPIFTVEAVSPTPEPSCALLLGAGLTAAFAGFKRKQRGSVCSD